MNKERERERKTEGERKRQRERKLLGTHGDRRTKRKRGERD